MVSIDLVFQVFISELDNLHNTKCMVRKLRLNKLDGLYIQLDLYGTGYVQGTVPIICWNHLILNY